MCVRTLIATLLLFGGLWSNGQMPSLAPQTGLSGAMLKLFGDINGFSAQADVRMLDKSNAESISLPLSVAMLGGKVRAEIDISRVKSKDLPPELLANLKQIGLDKMISILLPERKVTLIIYPSLHAYAESPISNAEAADMDKKYTMQATTISDEVMDGHRCTKNKVTFTTDGGQKREAVVWNALDLQKFPLQIEMNSDEGKTSIHFRNVQLAKPEAKLFEAPIGFAKEPSTEKLLEHAMLKALSK
jgi:hypothetical protein